MILECFVSSRTIYVNGYHAIKNEKVTNNHIYAGKERIATVVNGAPAFIHRDQINSGGLVTEASGDVEDRVAFSPYGEVIYQQNPDSELEEKFTGQIFDEETGLYYYNSRYYDPVVGVFISADSMVPHPYFSESMNRYMYVYGNPAKYIDPDGHVVGWIIGGAALFGFITGGTEGFTTSKWNWEKSFWEHGMAQQVQPLVM